MELFNEIDAEYTYKFTKFTIEKIYECIINNNIDNLKKMFQIIEKIDIHDICKDDKIKMIMMSLYLAYGHKYYDIFDFILEKAHEYKYDNELCEQVYYCDRRNEYSTDCMKELNKCIFEISDDHINMELLFSLILNDNDYDNFNKVLKLFDITSDSKTFQKFKCRMTKNIKLLDKTEFLELIK